MSTPLSNLEWQLRFHLLEESLTDYAVFSIDREGLVTSWNPGVEQVLGYPPTEFVGLPFEALFTLEDRALARPAEELARAAATGRSDDKRFHVRRDGSRFPADGVVRAIAGTTGVHGYLKVMHDASRQRHASDALRDSEERYRLLVENVRDYAVFLLDARGHVASWTAEAQRMKGYAPHEVVGQHLRVFFTQEDRDNGMPERELARAAADGRAEGEGWRVRKDGTRFWGDEIVAPIRDEDGSLRGFAKIVRDLTARQLAAIEQRELYAQAHEANRLKDEFLDMVSHELRTPLNAILGWSHLLALAATEFDATQTRAVQAITRNAQIQVQLVDDLLDVSRIVSGQVKLQVETAILADVVKGAVDSVRPAASAKSIDLSFHIEPRDALVRADRDRLQQVIWNLLSNAIKFTPSGGRVDLWATTTAGDTEIVVADNGIGIDPAVLPFVFDRFRQADSSTTRRHGGVGLGLAIVRHLAEQHGGTVEVASHGLGAGATFTVRLPAPQIPAEPTVTIPQRNVDVEASLPALHGVRVVVVDDDEDAREVLQTVLAHAGADVAVASSVASAMDCMATRRPDVVVADIGMPGEDGYALIRKLRQAPRAQGGAAPAIALTSFARAEDRAKALEAGFQLHLSKPIVPSAVVHAVASFVPQGRRATQTDGAQEP